MCYIIKIKEATQMIFIILERSVGVYPSVYGGRPLGTNEGRVQLHGGKAGLHKKTV